MVPPRSPPDSRRSSWLPRTHSVMSPITGSPQGPNSVLPASGSPARFRAASITAICMPKQMPKIGHLALARELAATSCLDAALAEAAGTRMPCTPSRYCDVNFLLEDLAVEPVELDAHMIGDAAMGQRLGQRLVAVEQGCICRRWRS